MALHWPAKAPGDITQYRWALDGCGVSAVSVSVTGTATATYKLDDDGVVFTVTGGAADAVQVLALSATVDGETITETAYIPVRTTTRKLNNTAGDVVAFALRKITGIAEQPEAEEAQDALERLSDMLAMWAGEGAALGVKLPCETTDMLAVSDAFLSAIKHNLILRLLDLYPGYEPSPFVVSEARRGLQQIKTALMPSDRMGAEFF